MAATASGADDNVARKYLAESLKRFCRSIELCDDYLRGYYGLKLVTSKVLNEPAKFNKQTDADDFAFPSTAIVERLAEKATQKLSEIVRHGTTKEKGWSGYDDTEITAAQELLSEESFGFVR